MSRAVFEVFSMAESTPLLPAITDRYRAPPALVRAQSHSTRMRPFLGEDGEYLPFRYHSFKENLMILGIVQFSVCLVVFAGIAIIGSNLSIGFLLISPVGLSGLLSFTFFALLKHSFSYAIIEENIQKIQKLNVAFLFCLLVMLILPIQALTVAFSISLFSGIEKFFLSVLSGFSVFLIFIPICSVWGTLLPYKYV